MQRVQFRGFNTELPPNTVYVGRPSKYGNHYDISQYGREEALAKYERWLLNELHRYPRFLDDLKGKDLACWCKPEDKCHADIIIKFFYEKTDSEGEKHVSTQWRQWTCPFCNRTFRFKTDFYGKEWEKTFKEGHSRQHAIGDKQTRLSSGRFNTGEHPMEVKSSMKIPAEAVEETKAKSGLSFLKVGELGLKLSQTLEFEIIGDVEQGGTESKPFYSVPVSYHSGKDRGQYRLNKTTLRAFVPTLGDDTATWLGAKFTAFAQMVNNPSTGHQQLGLTVLVDSVRAPKK